MSSQLASVQNFREIRLIPGEYSVVVVVDMSEEIMTREHDLADCRAMDVDLVPPPMQI